MGYGFRLGFKVDYNAAPFKVGNIILIFNYAAACCYNFALRLTKPFAKLPFHAAKIRLTLFFKYLGNAHALALFNEIVHIYKLPFHFYGKPFAYACFTAAHKAYKHYVSCIVHKYFSV